LLEENGLGEHLNGFVGEPGVESPADLHFLAEEDLRSLGFKPVPARRIPRLFAGPDSTIPCSRATHNDGDAEDEQSPPSTGSFDPAGKDDGGDAAGAGGDVDPAVACGDGDDGMGGGSCGADGEGLILPAAKRRKQLRLSTEQLNATAATPSEGGDHVALPFRIYKSADLVRLDAAAAGGRGQVPESQAGGCPCVAVLNALDCCLGGARCTARERLQVDRSGTRKGAQVVYNYARLATLVIELLSDQKGNWLIHEACARDHLRVSNWRLARCHFRALDAALTPTRRMTKSAIASSLKSGTLINRIRRFDDCLLSTMQYYKSSSLSTTFEVAEVHTEHGLGGMPSNRTKHVERARFQQFVVANSTPTGRTADKPGRYHGAANYLNSRWTVLRSSRSDTYKRPSFPSAFNEALSSARLQTVHPDVPLRWLRELFGATKKVDGCYVPSDKYKTLYPHETDACSTCCVYAADLRQARQSLKRHLEQPDQATMERIDAVSGVRRIISDLETALDGHKAGANRAISYHKTCVSGAAQRYDRLATQFQSVFWITWARWTCAPSRRSARRRRSCACRAAWSGTSCPRTTSRTMWCPAGMSRRNRGRPTSCRGKLTMSTSFAPRAAGTRRAPLVSHAASSIAAASASAGASLPIADVLLGGPAIGTEVPPLYRSGYGPERLLLGDARASPFHEPSYVIHSCLFLFFVCL